MSKELHRAFVSVVAAAAASATRGHLAEEVRTEHPTLSGQLLKWMAMGICRAVMQDEKWMGSGLPDPSLWPSRCDVHGPVAANRPHPGHDGRWSCAFVLGCFDVTRQQYI